MHILNAQKKRIELDLVPPEQSMASLGAREFVAAAAASPLTDTPVARAGRAFFGLAAPRGATARAAAPPAATEPAPAVFRERATGLVRTVHREVVVRFLPKTPAARRRSLIEKFGFEVRRSNAFVTDQVVVAHKTRRRFGADLFEVANDLAETDEVVFATPNFVSQYRRAARLRVPPEQWHLRNLAKLAKQLEGEDVKALDAWKITRGKREIVVAVLDDGVDIDHPALQAQIWRNPSKSAKDQKGRDFVLDDDNADHYNPRPKQFAAPFHELNNNDIHGTPCAGVIVANDARASGIAPGCRLLAIKIFRGNDLARDERVADAIRYAARHADILSCSWTGGSSPDVQLAIEDACRMGRGGKGSPVFCAVGNDYNAAVRFPASTPQAIGVGASTDRAELANYSNVGSEVDLVAPSSGGAAGIFTTDVSLAGRGFNLGVASQGGVDGLHTNDFGGTSSATPLAAGIAALVLSVNPRLGHDEVRSILRSTTDKIGTGYDAQGHSPEFGYGRVNAGRAVAEAAK